MGIEKWSKTDLAWFAGLFEGEGTLERRVRSGVKMSIHMTDEDVIRHVHELIGGSVYFGSRSKKNPNHQDIWIWQISSWPTILPLIAAMLPYMGQRRRANMDRILAEAAANPRRKGSYKPCDLDLGVSNAGYLWHQKRGLLPACESCMASYRAYMARWQANHRDKTRGYEHAYRARKNAERRLKRQTQTSTGSASPPSEMPSA